MRVKGVIMSLALHYWMRGAHHCSGPPWGEKDLYCVEWDVKLYYTIPYESLVASRKKSRKVSFYTRHVRAKLIGLTEFSYFYISFSWMLICTSSMMVECFFNSAFLSDPYGSPATFVSILAGLLLNPWVPAIHRPCAAGLRQCTSSYQGLMRTYIEVFLSETDILGPDTHTHTPF